MNDICPPMFDVLYSISIELNIGLINDRTPDFGCGANHMYPTGIEVSAY